MGAKLCVQKFTLDMEFSQEKLIYQYSNTCKSTENPEQYGLQKA